MSYRNLLCASLLCASVGPALAQDYLPILQYHHVDASTPRATSVSPEEFREHMDYLADAGFEVVDLAKALTDLKAGVDIPEKSVAITFDDAYRSIYQNGFPILKEHGFPFTVFVNTQPILQKNRHFLTWQQIKVMALSGGTFSNHTVSHPYMLRKEKGESHAAWKARMTQEVASVESSLIEHLGGSPKMLAYPYGESNQTIRALIKEQGMVAFGQQSGVVSKGSDFTNLPRFPAAGNYAKLSTLKVKLNALPMPLVSSEREDFADEAPVSMTLTLAKGSYRTKDFACYVSGQGAAQLTWLDEQSVIVAATAAFDVGRGRINCTMSNRAGDRYYWFSHVWIRPSKDQGYVTEKTKKN